jgi:hypothetical protein
MIVWSYLILKSLKSLKSWPFIFSSQGDTYWLVVSIPLKKYEFVSWDDGSQLNGEIRNVPNHLPDIYIILYINNIIYIYIITSESRVNMNTITSGTSSNPESSGSTGASPVSWFSACAAGSRAGIPCHASGNTLLFDPQSWGFPKSWAYPRSP